MMVSIPRTTLAQCTCGGGVAPVAVSQTQVVGPTNNSSSTLYFNQYYDPTGKLGLACFNFDDTLWAASTSHVINGDADTTIYNFTTQVNYTITGPAFGGINLSNSKTLLYGPDTLGGVGQPGNSETHGPDSTFTGAVRSTHGNFNTGPYGGAGLIPIAITFGGGSIASGGSNYTYTIQTNYVAIFHLTYYLCPTVALASSIKTFSAVPNGSSILLQWTVDNQQNNTSYEIQVSTDGKNFTSVGEAESNPATTGSSAKYQYQYNPDPTNVGKVWFRIKETDATGKVSYSTVAVLAPGDGSAESGPVSYGIYPNPATNSIIFQFGGNQTGRYLVELVNTAGQVVQQKPVTLTGTSQIRLDLSPQPVKGLYFLRTTDITRNQRYVSKIFIN
jgi:hypothetical protein